LEGGGARLKFLSQIKGRRNQQPSILFSSLLKREREYKAIGGKRCFADYFINSQCRRKRKKGAVDLLSILMNG